MQLKTVAVIFNPMGGSANQATLGTLVSSLVAAGVDVKLVPTTAAPNSARDLAREAYIGGVDLVVAFGGDWTARQVAEALKGTDCVEAVYPGGTGNLFSQNFMSPPPPAEFARMLLEGDPQPVDLIEFDAVTADGGSEKGLFLVGLGFGPLSDAISDAEPKWKKIFGRLVYAYNMVRRALRPKGVTATFETPHKTFEAPVAAAFALNVQPHTMPFLARGCTPSDGRVDLVVVKGRYFHQLVGCGACLTAMRPERSRYYQRVRSAEMRITTNRPVTLNVDGDPGPTTSDFRLTVLPSAVRMILA